MMKKIMFFISFLIYISFIHNSYSQILNIERQRDYDDTLDNWKGYISTQIDVQKQQVQTIMLGYNENVTYYGHINNYSIISEAHLLKVKGSDILSNGYIHLRANFFKRKKVSYEFFGQGQYDEARGLKERLLVGSGLRFHKEVSHKFSAAIGNGLMYEFEHWNFKDIDSTTIFLKNTNYVSFHYEANNMLNIILTGYYQARFETFDKPRIIGDFSLDIKLGKKLRYTVRYSILHDAIPVVPINKTIYSLRNGLRYDF
ncbi:MAG: hypothetical protein OHK0038_14490 [Flammeovirgaceae bacterium]